MAGQVQMPVKVLVAGEVREYTGEGGRKSRSRTLQCFTGDVVGEIRHYLREDEPDEIQPGDYMATIGWSNYQGRLQPRILGLEAYGRTAQKPAPQEQK